jgi:hypothetical protein
VSDLSKLNTQVLSVEKELITFRSSSQLSQEIPPPSPSVADETIYILRPGEDAKLLRIWHDKILPSVTAMPSDFNGLTTMHLVRQGLSEERSMPTILISTKPGANEELLRKKISSLFKGFSVSLPGIQFEEESLRRTIDDNLPPICKARNTQSQPLPVGGASIGIYERLDCTATLGGYLMIDGRAYALTVDHIVPEVRIPGK